MESLRMKEKKLYYLLAGLLAIYFFLYSFSSTPVYYIGRQGYENYTSKSSTHHLQERVASPVAEEALPSTQWEESPLNLESAAVVPSSSLTPFTNYVNIKIVHDIESFNITKGTLAGTEEAPTFITASAQEQREQKSSKKDVPALAPIVARPMARGVITSSLYVAGHDIAATQLCQDDGSGMQLLVIVTSAPNHFKARMAIRLTWGHFGKRRDISLGFIVATSKSNETRHQLEAESALYSDIIAAKFVDSYRNLTLKTISIFEWAYTYCPKVQFVLKTDDDMFINVPRLLSFIKEHSGDKRTIYGRLAKKWKPFRNIRSKYYVSPQVYRPAAFPDFVTGPAYLLTSDTIYDLYVTALNKTYLNLEDVYVTGLVAKDIKIKLVHTNEFANTRIPFQACIIQKKISIHKVMYPEQFDLWKKLLDGTNKCK